MRIILEPSEYYLEDNVGHVVMTQVAVARLTSLWPSASIEILTEPSASVSEFCPGAIAVLKRRVRGEARSRVAAQLSRLSGISQSIALLKSALRRRSPSLFGRLKRLKSKLEVPRPDYSGEECDAIKGADLMVVSGMGGVTETFREYAFRLLYRIECALDAGIPVAMMGQGIGPLRDPELLARSAEVLPRVALICVREGRFSPSILTSLGVPGERILITGDDAVEVAFVQRPETLGNCLGVNLRVARYSSVDLSLGAGFASIVQQTATNFDAALVPLPIDREDIRPIEMLVSGYRETKPFEYVENPIRVIESVRKCRVIVTGSYHAAVFALSIGVPAVCIASSDYYVEKFLGLRYQFGSGCEVVMLAWDNWPARVLDALRDAWRSAEQIRPKLLEAARKQVELGRTAYDAVPEMFQRCSPHYRGGFAPGERVS